MSKFTVNTAALLSLRTLAGLQAKELAERAGISPQFVCDIEMGRRIPSPPVAKKIAKALGVPMASFFAVKSESTKDGSEVA